jgi:hypothetical protein
MGQNYYPLRTFHDAVQTLLRGVVAVTADLAGFRPPDAED